MEKVVSEFGVIFEGLSKGGKLKPEGLSHRESALADTSGGEGTLELPDQSLDRCPSFLGSSLHVCL